MAKEVRAMTPKNNAFRNLLIGGGLGLVFAIVIDASIVFSAYQKNLSTAGGELTLVAIAVAFASWFALLGFCITRSANDSRTRRYLRVLLAVTASMIGTFLFSYAVGPQEFGGVLIFAVIVGITSGAITTKYQFSKDYPK